MLRQLNGGQFDRIFNNNYRILSGDNIYYAYRCIFKHSNCKRGGTKLSTLLL